MRASNCVSNLQSKDRDQQVFERNLAVAGSRVVNLPTTSVDTDKKEREK